MFSDGSIHQLPDVDPQETGEWLESLDAVIDVKGKARAHYLLARLMERAREKGSFVPAMVTTDYINTIAPEQEPWFPGNEDIERRIRAFVRWNAVAMVDRANHRFDGLGGHLSTYASAASLYEVGFNHFFRGKGDGGFGDQIYFQGHAAPGIYAARVPRGPAHRRPARPLPPRDRRASGLPSYPHPRRLPTFWEYPTVSMGLGPLNAVYQARFNRYLYNRKLVDTSSARVWCFVGDGEMDEPEATAALDLAARERLDNLIFVVNCNLQRLDGPVRGDGKVIQEFESTFRGMGWNVLKVIWGRQWDELLARDVDGVLVNKMNTTVDGEFQKYVVESGAYIREHFFGPDPRLRKMVEHLSDDELQRLPRGGHDYRKIFAAYKTAVEHEGTPTVILAKTVKGWTLGADFEARNATHQIKKMSPDQLKALRDRLYLEIPDKDLESGMAPYFHPGVQVARVRVHDGAPARARRLPARPGRAFEDRRVPARRDHRPADGGHRREGAGVDDDGVRAAVARAVEGTRDRAARRADHPRRGAHVRPRRALRRVQDLRAVRPAVRARRRGADALVPRSRPTASCSKRASPKPARWRRSPRPRPRTRRGASR